MIYKNFSKSVCISESLIFVHIPKCGGSSIHGFLKELLGMRYVHFEGAAAETYSYNQACASGGHQKFGTNPLYSLNYPSRHISLIRNPLSRFESFFRHVQSHPDHQLHLYNADLASFNCDSFFDYLIDINYHEISNLMCSMLCPDLNNSSDCMSFIKDNYDLVGDVSHINLFFNELCDLVGIRQQYQLEELNKSELISVNLSKRIISKLELINSLDFEIYSTFPFR